MSHILITGGTGLIGRSLTSLLMKNGHEVTILSRTKKQNVSGAPGLNYAHWDPDNKVYDADAFSRADFIVHLAGAGVADKRWTKKRKEEIADSRVAGSTLIVKALQETNNRVKAVISSSAIGWYGGDNEKSRQNGFSETDPAEDDFLGITCQSWEKSISQVQTMGKRLVILRTGIVLSTEGGAFREFMKPIKFGFATILGNGFQKVSWIHISDICRMFLTAIESPAMFGIYNAVAPNPVTNKELTLCLAGVARGRFFLPIHVPAFLLKIVLGEMSIEVLKSATISSKKIEQAGFRFAYSHIEPAIQALLKS
jgi:hypothetical protein